MTMNRDNQSEIVKSTVDSFRVKCSHRSINVTADELQRIGDLMGEILEKYQDNSMILNNAEWDNS